jgi:hypothetical protein
MRIENMHQAEGCPVVRQNMSMKCHKNVNGIFVIWRETLKRVRFKIPNVLQFFTFSLDTTTTVLVLGAHSPPVSSFYSNLKSRSKARQQFAEV